ncbi:MAG TPA: DUF4340 domain-containing protein [Gemmatimonadales bacterium]|nr:DUF4340 domain-containing protein [Gemmatimonadales bacterium]
MSPRQLAIAAIVFGSVLLLWGAAALWRRGDADTGAAPGAVVPPIARSAVDTVTIARPKDTTVLARRDSTRWTANGHAASGTAVSVLLDALADGARRAEPVAERAASHAGLGVDSASGAKVRVAGAKGVLADFVVGQRTPDLQAGYVRRAGDSVVYLVRGPLAEALSRDADEWRDRSLGGVSPDSVAAIELVRGRRTTRVTRDSTRWVLGNGRPADSAAVRGVLEAWRSVDAAGFASKAQADSARFSPADRRVRLLRADGSPLLGLALDSMASGYWAKLDTGATVYRMESWTVDRLMPADSALSARARQAALK